MAAEWARARNVPQEPYPVDYALDGPWPSAGPRRNYRMLKHSRPTSAVVFPGGKGTKNMRDRLKQHKIPTKIITE